MYHFIVNPASRSGKGQRLWAETIKPALAHRNIKYEVHFSRKPGDVITIVEKLMKSGSKVPMHLIILGGDGTVNETLQGIDDFSKVIISYIPTGSSNDLARDMGIAREPLKALDAILDGANTVPMDVGLLTTANGVRRFAVSCGIGFDAAVCHESMQSKIKTTLNRLGLGKFTYLGIALKQILAAKPVSCDLYLDDKEPIHIKKILFAASMNHRYEGGGFMFCPNAVCNDGYLDLCVVGNLPKLFILFALPTAFWGKHLNFPEIYSYRAKKVRIETSTPLWVHTDGEVIQQSKSITLSCDQQVIPFLF